ncbi:hypothetical protein BGZ83_000445, partial [Gryganskiella cystojenkinii]
PAPGLTDSTSLNLDASTNGTFAQVDGPEDPHVSGAITKSVPSSSPSPWPLIATQVLNDASYVASLLIPELLLSATISATPWRSLGTHNGVAGHEDTSDSPVWSPPGSSWTSLPSMAHHRLHDQHQHGHAPHPYRAAKVVGLSRKPWIPASKSEQTDYPVWKPSPLTVSHRFYTRYSLCDKDDDLKSPLLASLPWPPSLCSLLRSVSTRHAIEVSRGGGDSSIPSILIAEISSSSSSPSSSPPPSAPFLESQTEEDIQKLDISGTVTCATRSLPPAAAAGSVTRAYRHFFKEDGSETTSEPILSSVRSGMVRYNHFPEPVDQYEYPAVIEERE